MRSLLIRVLLVACLGLAPMLASADVPRLINYQGRLSASGTPLSGDYTITFSLYDAPENGAAVWSETHDVTVNDGVFSVVLGSLAAFPATLFADHDELFLGIRVAGEAELTPRHQLVSTPYSFQAASADAVRNGAIGTSQIADGAVTTTKLADGAVTGSKLAAGALVNSVNGASGAVTVEGAGGVSVTTAGSTITIAAQGGGGGNAGVQAIQSGDNALTITNPIGPTVTLDVRQGGIAAGMLADDAVTSSSIADGAVEAVDLAETAAVKTVNGMNGAITIAGEGGATVTSSGNTITINAGSGGGASGVQGIQNTDGFLSITNPNGPTVTVDVASGAVTTDMLRDGSVTTPKIANLGVTEEKVANNAITSAKIADGQIQAADLAATAAVRTINTVSGDVTLAATGAATLARNGNTLTINVPPATTSGIRNLTNTDGAISVTAPNGPTTTIGIAAAGIKTNMIADDAVTGPKIAAGAVGATQLATSSVGTGALADGAVTSAKIADDQVTTADLQNGAVTAAKLAPNAVTSGAILDGSITAADFAANAAVNTINGRDGAITIRGAGATQVTTVGDTLIISGGLVSVGVSSVTSPGGSLTVGSPNGPNVTLEVAPGAIDAARLAANSVTSGAIADDAVGASEIAADAVGSSEIAADAVGSSEIATDAVGSDEIATGAVGSDEIADGSVTAADLAPSSINGSSIVDGSIGAAKLAANSVVTDLAGLRGSISVTGGGTITVQTIPGMNELRISSVGPSSIRWKKDVETLDNALAIVEQLRGVRYTWKETGKEDIGFIAEEVGQVLPEIVAWEENGVDAQGVDYARVVSVLVEAVKEQQREIDAQQQTLAQLAERLAKLEGQMNQASADASIR